MSAPKFSSSPTESVTLALQAEPYYMLRRPLLPIEGMHDLHRNTPDLATTLQLLLDLYRQPLLQEAIYLASPFLHAELLKSLDSPPSVTSKAGKRLLETLYKYYLRMSLRATPYGLFAGCITGQLAPSTCFEFEAQPLRLATRLDTYYLSGLVSQLLKMPGVRENVRYYPNNTLYVLGGRYRYVEAYSVDERLSYELATVSDSPYLAAALAIAKNGAQEEEIITAVQHASTEPATREAARAFVEELKLLGIIISEIEPTITGELFIEKLMRRLPSLASREVVSPLQKALELLKKGGVANYAQLPALLQQYGEVNPAKLIHGELFFATQQSHLSTQVANTITEQLQDLAALAQTGSGSKDALTAFSNAFRERYEDQTVPLLLALDSELGIGYADSTPESSAPAPLLAEITPASAANQPAAGPPALVALATTLALRATETGTQAIELTEQDLRSLDAPGRPVTAPASMFVFGSLLASSQQALDSGEFLFDLRSYSGPSVAKMLGRFCHTDEHLLEHVRQTLREAEPDTDTVVYAEIVHIPQARVGNVLVRPVLRAYEIPLLTPSGVGEEHQILLQDLYVKVQGGEVMLYSQRLKKRVIPRLSNAHVYQAGLPIYSFLAALQRPYTIASWNWYALNQQFFLPRVSYKNIVLSQARWLVRRGQVTDEASLVAFFKQHKLPRYLELRTGDNRICIDQEMAIARELLLAHLERNEEVRIWEWLATPDQCWLKDGALTYTNELLLPVRNKLAVPPQPVLVPKSEAVPRTFAPGSEWLFIKLYSGPKSGEQLLTEYLLPLTEKWLAEGLISSWFFIRYNDLGPHLRVRLHLSAAGQQALGILLTQLNELLEPALTANLVQRIQLDTYVRELDRYGALNIADTEELFGYDSRATAQVLAHLEGAEGEEYRWLLALRGLDELLTDFGLSLAEKEDLLRVNTQLFFKEFRGDKPLQVQLNEKFRQHRVQLTLLLDPTQDKATGVEEATQLFQERRRIWSPVISRIIARSSKSELTKLLHSYVHMFCNRFVLAQPRMHELVLYSLLHKYYVGQLAQLRDKKVTE